jgi:hypothetical protein
VPHAEPDAFGVPHAEPDAFGVPHAEPDAFGVPHAYAKLHTQRLSHADLDLQPDSLTCV